MRILFILLFSCLSIPAFSNYKGIVYIDTNQSGDYDKQDTPLSNITVTDGLNVTKTDRNGKFILPGHDKARFITITTPAGYTTPNYYIPIDRALNSYNFALEEDKRTKTKEHSFIQITDTEVMGGVGSWTTDLKGYIKSEQPAFLIHTGDICYESGLNMHKQVVNSQTMGCPVYYGIGNHDLTKGNYGEELFESIYGPVWYSFDIGNTHYVMTPMLNGDHAPSYTKEDVCRWLKNDLSMMQKGQSLVIFNHDIWFTGDDFIITLNDDKESIDLRDYNLKAWIYGHWHYNYIRNQNGIYTICTGTIDKGGIDHSAAAFRVLNIDNTDAISTKLRYAYIEPQVSIVSPMNGQSNPQLRSEKLPLSINTYNSQALVKNITYSITENENDEIITSGTITNQLTDWNWVKDIDLSPTLFGKSLQVNVSVLFSDNKKVTASNIFEYNKESQSVLLGNNWNTLLSNAQHTGDTNTKITSPLQLAWTNNMGTNIFMSSPIIANARIFVASADDNIHNKSSIRAYDAQSGSLLWQYKTRNSIKNSIAYDINTIVAQDAEGYLYAIDATTGQLKWEKKINNNPYPYFTEGLTVENGIVYAGTGDCLSAYIIETGNQLWKNTSWVKNEAATTTLTIAGNTLISGTQWGALYGNDKNTGALLWKISKDGMSDRGASPVYKDGKLYIISRKHLFIINPETGEIIKQKESSLNLDVTSTPLITENEIIFGTANRGLLSLDKKALYNKWNLQTKPSLIFTAPYTTAPDASVETSPVLSQGTIYIGASDGYLYAIEANTGIIKQKVNMGAPILSTVAISGNTLIVCDYSGNIYAFISK